MSVRAASQCVLKMPRVLTCQDHTHALVTMDSQGMELSHAQVKVLAKYSAKLYLQVDSPNPDVNECDLSLDTCDTNALCKNLFGSFFCECNFGYTGTGNECSEFRDNM